MSKTIQEAVESGDLKIISPTGLRGMNYDKFAGLSFNLLPFFNITLYDNPIIIKRRTDGRLRIFCRVANKRIDEIYSHDEYPLVGQIFESMWEEIERK
jgi:hypothetical protein